MRRLFLLTLAGIFLIVFAGGTDAYARRGRRIRPHKAAAAAQVKKPYRVSAKAALVMEMDSGRRIYEKDISRKVLPASTTKQIGRAHV